MDIIKLIKEEPAKVQEALTYWLTLKQEGLRVSTYQEVFVLLTQEVVAILHTYTQNWLVNCSSATNIN